MTDEEIICADLICEWMQQFELGFHLYGYPIRLIEQLGLLHQVEARLTEAQAATYDLELWKYVKDMARAYKWHATAKQKIKALATVIRAEAGKEPQS